VIAVQMADYRNLPMARHNEEAMQDTAAHKTFERFVQSEQELTALLQKQLREDQSMLQRMPA
jgi:hypothetical protein